MESILEQIISELNQCYDIIDTKTNQKMNKKSFVNKKKALGRVATANIAHGTERYKLQPIELKENEEQLSPQYATRLEHDWSNVAGEPVKIDKNGGFLYAYGSELACLRLFYKMQTGRVKYSDNLKTWYYSKDVLK